MKFWVWHQFVVVYIENGCRYLNQYWSLVTSDDDPYISISFEGQRSVVKVGGSKGQISTLC